MQATHTGEEVFLLDVMHRGLLRFLSFWRVGFTLLGMPWVFSFVTRPAWETLPLAAILVPLLPVIVGVRTGEIAQVGPSSLAIVGLNHRTREIPLGEIVRANVGSDGQRGPMWVTVSTRTLLPWRRWWIATCTDWDGLAEALNARGVKVTRRYAAHS